MSEEQSVTLGSSTYTLGAETHSIALCEGDHVLIGKDIRVNS